MTKHHLEAVLAEDTHYGYRVVCEDVINCGHEQNYTGCIFQDQFYDDGFSMIDIPKEEIVIGRVEVKTSVKNPTAEHPEAWITT